MADESNSVAIAGFIGTPIGSFLVAVVIGSVFQQPCNTSFGNYTIHEQCVAGMHTDQFVKVVAGVCWAVGWVVFAFWWFASKAGSTSDAA